MRLRIDLIYQRITHGIENIKSCNKTKIHYKWWNKNLSLIGENSMCKYLIISDPDDINCDEKILKFLRRFHVDFSTGFYFNGEASDSMGGCIWYYFINNENMKEVFALDHAFRYGKNKIMAEDGFFSCNCADFDLPLIEDVWEALDLDNES